MLMRNSSLLFTIPNQADPRLLAALDLMRRMPPSRMESSLEGAQQPDHSTLARATLARARFVRVCRSPPLAATRPCGAELVDLVPDLTDDLLNTVDQPLQLAKDAKGNAYLLCDYNRDGDSYR